jgi:hypothetical protein
MNTECSNFMVYGIGQTLKFPQRPFGFHGSQPAAETQSHAPATFGLAARVRQG